MKRFSAVLITLIIIALLAYPKISGLFNTTATVAGTGSQAEESSLVVDIYVVAPHKVDDNIYITGSLRANEEVELTSESSGLIKKIYFNEGQDVKKGDLLVKINDSELRANLTSANFRLKLAEATERRQKQLLEKGGISQEEYDATQNEVNVLRAQVELINAQIEKTEITAPFDGKIGLKYVSEGSYLSPATRVASLQSIDPIKIDFSVPERYASQINEGTKITFKVQGMAEEVQGIVYAKEPKIDAETRTLQARAMSPNRSGRLLPGAFADITLTLSTIEDALMVPTVTVVPELNGQKVFILKNGHVEPVSVTTGIRGSEMVQIASGLAPGDSVLTTGLLEVRPGSKVLVSNIE